MASNNTNISDNYFSFVDEIDLLPDYDQDEDYIIYETSRFTVGFVTVFLNTILVSCFCREKGIPQNSATKRLLLSLSVCDLITGLVVIGQAACFYWKQVTYVGVVLALDILRVFLTKTYVMHLCGLALDKYMSVFCALRYKAIVTDTTITCYVIITWCFPFTFSVIRLFWLLKYKNDVEYWYSVIGFNMFLAIPMFLLAIAFVKLFFEIRRILKSPPAGRCVSAVRRVSKELRVISTFSFMYLTFLVVAMPYFTLRMWIITRSRQGKNLNVDEDLLKVILVIKDVTSFINPICYTIITPDVRKTCRKRLTRSPNTNNMKLLSKKHDASEKITDYNSKQKGNSLAEMNV